MVNATAPDGTVEGWEPLGTGPITSYIMAVQWHPERAAFDDPVSRPLFQDFIRASASFAVYSR
jgi:gamma-glutamyl-gamma-aminobutyrate hydrolase PuuD